MKSSGLAAGLLVIGILAGCFPEEKRGPDLFNIPVTYPVGKKPSTVVAQDMNGDGYPDILVPSSEDHTIHYYEGTGNGSFKQPFVIKTGREPVALATGDFNGDGVADIAACNYGDDNVMIILGQKDGLFLVNDRIKTGRLPIAIVAADFNNDKKLDLAVTLRFDKLIILLGVGDGTFQLAESYQAPGTPARLVAGDYNGDNTIDIAIVSNAVQANAIEVFYGKGDGAFNPPKRFSGGTQSAFITQFDMNLDGRLDLIISSFMADSLTMFLNAGKEEFSRMPDTAGEKGPQDIVVGEFTGDKFPDLVVSNQNDGSISVLEGRGDGTFVFPHYNYPVGRGPRSLAGADFNNDGLQDLVVVLHDAALIEVLIRKKDSSAVEDS